MPSRDIPRYIALYKRGRLPVDRLITSSGPLDDINAAFDLLAEGKTIRYVGATGALQFDELGNVQAPKMTWKLEGDENVETE